MREKLRKESKGITLIALVITIIVLLILAAVTISTLTGDNGILTKANSAKQKNNEAKEKENIGLAVLAEKTNQLGEKLTAKGLQEELKELGANATVTEEGDGFRIKFKDSGIEYVTDKDGNIIKVYKLSEEDKPETEEVGAWTKLNKISKTGGFDSNKGVNSPNLGSELTAVTLTTDLSAYESNGTWYNYEAQTATTESGGTSKWANAVTTDTDGSITGYYVWIPRYAYKITKGYHGNGLTYSSNTTTEAGIIEVKFLKGITNEFADGTGTAETDPSKITYTDGVQDQWLVHPAFLSDASIGGGFGSKNGDDDGITGIWIAKFEISAYIDGEDTSARRHISRGFTAEEQIKLRVLPGVQSSSIKDIGTMYELSYNMNRSADSHMLKNSEWGAMAYLAHSKYGRNGTEITINNTCYASIDSYSSNDDTYTGGSNTETGYLSNGIQSTTGNAYGIYDINGGKYEYVASYVNNGDAMYGGTMTSSEIVTSTKYKTVYNNSESDNESANYELAIGVKGDAVYETSTVGDGYSSWFSDYSCFPNANSMFFIRGGESSNGYTGGLFCFFTHNGDCGGGDGDECFRSCLVVD